MPRPDPYVRPYGDTAPWNIQISGTGAPYGEVLDYPGVTTFGNDPGLQAQGITYLPSGLYERRLWDYAPANPGYFALSMWDYTYPVYYVSDATDTYTFSGGYCGSQNGHINGTTVPWNPAWAAAPGSDAQIILLDDSTGKEWDIYGVQSVNTSTKVITVRGGSIVGTKDSCNIAGNTTGNYKTKVNGWGSRGVGIQYLAMLVRPEEILASSIQHALSMPIRDPSMEFFVPPATKLERFTGSPGGVCDQPGETWPSCVPPNYAIPEGMRFHLKYGQLSNSMADGVQHYKEWAIGGPFSDEATEVEAWITYYHSGKTTAQKNFIRTIALALYRYGWFITDHSGAAHWQLEAAVSADAFGNANLWSDMGINASQTNSQGTNFTVRHYMDHLACPPSLISTTPDIVYDGGSIRAVCVPDVYGLEPPGLASLVFSGTGANGAATAWSTPEGVGM